MVVKKPGLEMDTEMSELDLSYQERYSDVNIPDAYERLILDCIRCACCGLAVGGCACVWGSTLCLAGNTHHTTRCLRLDVRICPRLRPFASHLDKTHTTFCQPAVLLLVSSAIPFADIVILHHCASPTYPPTHPHTLNSSSCPPPHHHLCHHHHHHPHTHAHRGDQQHFVRRDELRAAWSIFTPLLHGIDRGDITPEPYPYGSRGPADQDRFLADSGYLRSVRYIWRPADNKPQQGGSGAEKAPAAAGSAAASAKPNL